ncbi:hypothetical protein PGTUg99_015230 [Puccinia graminis f. sp. tritici]|uniref:Uncharacterized protein n=1 Tax=Puccinia graminis f. sp. tritici TaxID=56615 RepID=A0A5B0QU42_PUCGR|nr:hypothetical protein PGTUg99_015230 [Puccinia graminis f. sp. tritici]
MVTASAQAIYQPAAFSVLRLTLSQFVNRTNHHGRGHSPTNAAHSRELGTCVQSAKEWVCAAHQACLT